MHEIKKLLESSSLIPDSCIITRHWREIPDFCLNRLRLYFQGRFTKVALFENGIKSHISWLHIAMEVFLAGR